MERSEFGEILRIIQIIENFKNEARAKFSVKIAFILSVDRKEIEARIKNACNNEKAQIIEKFLKDKLVDNLIFLPKNIDKFKQFVQDSVNEVITKFGFKKIVASEVLDKAEIDGIMAKYESAKDLQAKTSAIIELISMQEANLGFLNKATPRIIVRLKNNLNYFLSRIKAQLATQLDESVKDFLHVKIEDVIFLQFIKVKNPQFYGFLNDNIDYYLRNPSLFNLDPFKTGLKEVFSEDEKKDDIAGICKELKDKGIVVDKVIEENLGYFFSSSSKNNADRIANPSVVKFY